MSILALADDLRAASALVDQAALDHTAQFVRRARSVTLTGQGRSGFVAHMIAMRLMHLGLVSHATGEATAPRVGDGDLLLAVSGSGRTPVTTHFARVAHDAGATVVAVVRSSSSDLGRLADHVVEVPPPVAKRPQPGGSLFEQTALLALDSVVLRCASFVDDVPAALALRHTNLQ